MLKRIWPRIVFSTRNFLSSALAFQILVISAYCAEAKDPWQSVRQLPHHASFMFLERDQTCYDGQISSTTDQHVIIHTDKSDLSIAKADLLRIQRGPCRVSSTYQVTYQVPSVVYSGRSSWVDIIGFMPYLSLKYHREVSILVATLDGKVLKGNLKEATDTEIVVIDSLNKETQIAKTQVSWVDYLQTKPLSDTQEYCWDELAALQIFDPVLYPRMFHLGDKMAVRLYDRTLPEDDSPIQYR